MNIELLAKSASKLFTLPEICIKIQDVIYDPSSSAADIAKLIAIDPSLSARLLKIANSSFYNFPSQIDQLDRAVNLIGTEDLYSLALATSTPSAFAPLAGNQLLDINSYWRHSVMTGLIGRALAQHCRLRHSEQLFLSGLFHNLGQLVILEQMPEMFGQIEALKNESQPPWEIEHEVMGYTYADIGAELLRCWKIPESIWELVKEQHDPSQLGDPQVGSLVHIASRTASQLEHTTNRGFNFSQTILPIAWSSTSLDQESVHTAIGLAEMNCQSMLSAMTGNQLPSP